MHKAYMKCKCGNYIESEVIEGKVKCNKCGKVYSLWYNPKTETYELEEKYVRQHNNTGTT